MTEKNTSVSFVPMRTSLVDQQILLTKFSFLFININSRYFLKADYIDKHYWLKYMLNMLLQVPTNLPYVVDGVQFLNSTVSWTFQFNNNSMLSDDRVTAFTKISSSNLSLASVSCIFTSCVWLERELADFSSINFLGLTDTRRLLLDYFELKGLPSTHISNDKNYNNELFDVFLNY